jgi:cytolysin-activating lysine-acyltransferase
MQLERITLTPEPSAEAHQNAAWLGMACAVLAASDAHQELPLVHLRNVLLPAIRHQQIKFYFDEQGRPAGYVIWAMLAEDVERRFLAHRAWLLHESEWNEGPMVWLVDLAARPGFARAMATQLRHGLFEKLDRLRYGRIRKGQFHLFELSREAPRGLRVQRA